MDALQKLNENFLSCNICTETFTDPCTLGCYHTFCKKCLTKFMESRSVAINANSIECPNCRQMTKVPRPQEPVDQWSQQFKPSFLIQGLLDTFTSHESSEPIEQSCFTCQQLGQTSQAKSVCEDCNILLCESCVIIHQATPVSLEHTVLPLEAGPDPDLAGRRVMCSEHNCWVEFCCKDCQKVACNKCCIVYHRLCNGVVTLDSMIPEMKQVLQVTYDDMELHLQRTGNTLTSRRSELEETTQHKFSLQSEIRIVSQRAVDLIRRKERELLDDLDTFTEMQTAELGAQIRTGEKDLQRYDCYTEIIKQVLQYEYNRPMDLFDVYTMCQSGEITADLQRNNEYVKRMKKAEFWEQFDLDELDRTLQLGVFNFTIDKFKFQYPPKHLAIVSVRSIAEKREPDLHDLEILHIDGIDTLVSTDFTNSNLKSFYMKDGYFHCTSLKVRSGPHALTKISHDTVAVSILSDKRIDLIKLTPDPVLVSSIKTRKTYSCLSALSDTTLAAGCNSRRASIYVLDLSGRVLTSVVTCSAAQQPLLGTGRPWYMTVFNASGSHCSGRWAIFLGLLYDSARGGSLLLQAEMGLLVGIRWCHNNRHRFSYRG